ADVVPAARHARSAALVPWLRRSPARERADRGRAAREESLPRRAAEVDPRAALRLPFLDAGHARGDRRLVVPHGGDDVPAAGVGEVGRRRGSGGAATRPHGDAATSAALACRPESRGDGAMDFGSIVVAAFLVAPSDQAAAPRDGAAAS